MSQEKTIRILIADDNAMVHNCLKLAFENQADIDIVAHARDGAEVIKLYQTHHPDVVLMDTIMGNMNGIDATREIRQFDPTACVVILSAHCEADLVTSAIEVGATSYVLKDLSARYLGSVIRKSYNGEGVFSEFLSRIMPTDEW